MKSVEEIRQEIGMTQSQFAEVIGTTPRTYQGRIYGEQPEWKLLEVVKASSFNDGQIRVKTSDGTYDISVQKVD